MPRRDRMVAGPDYFRAITALRSDKRVGSYILFRKSKLSSIKISSGNFFDIQRADHGLASMSPKAESSATSSRAFRSVLRNPPNIVWRIKE